MTSQTRGDILIADDESSILHLLVDFLSDEGYSVRTARNGQEAISEVWRHQPHILLMDVMMPYMNGEEVLVYLRSNGFTQLPIIMMSAGVDLRTFLDHGATATFTKPLELDLLLDLIESLRAKQQSGDEQNPPLQRTL